MHFNDPSVDQTAKRRYQDTLRCFNQALASLSDLEQNLFHLRCYQELPINELAALYGLTPGAISRRLRRIQSKLEQSYILQQTG